MGDSEDRGIGAATRRSLRVSSRSGHVEVIAEPRSDVIALKGGRSVSLEEEDERLTLSSRSSSLELRVPEGTDVVIGTVSGTVTCVGPLGHVAVNTISARITIEQASSVDARSVSGIVKVASCDGEARCDVISGRAEIGEAGSVLLSTTSGRITARQVRGKVRARSVSGRIKVGVTETPLDVKVGCFSGRIQVRVPRGARPSTQLTSKRGRVTNRLDGGDDGTDEVGDGTGGVGDGIVTARVASGSVLIDEAP